MNCGADKMSCGIEVSKLTTGRRDELSYSHTVETCAIPNAYQQEDVKTP